MNPYLSLFNEMYYSDIKRSAFIDGQPVRIIVGGEINGTYSNVANVSIGVDSREILLVNDEIPPSWKPKPDARLTINDLLYQVYQDVPPTYLDIDKTIIRLLIHKV